MSNEDKDYLIYELEKRRKLDRNFFLGVLTASCIILALLGYMFPPIWVAFCGLVLALINVNVFYLLHRHFKRKGKAVFLTEMAKEFNLNFSPSHAFEIQQMTHHGIIPYFDTKTTEDGFTSKNQSFPIAFQEAELLRIDEDKEKRTTYRIPVFRGLMIKVNLKKKLDFHTVIMPNKFLRPNVDVGNVPAKKGFQEVKIVSNKFSKNYKVYSTNQVESRVIFDPLFIERFMELGEHLGAKWLEASFKDNQLFIMAQYKKDHFEIGSILRPVMEDDLEKVREEIRHILAMSEMLKHNSYIGK